MERMTIDSLIAYMDGEVTQNRAERIERELRRDPVATQQLDRLREIRGGLKDAVEPSHIRDIKPQILDRIKSEETHRKTRRIPAIVASLSAAIPLIALIVVILKPDSSETFTPRGPTAVTQSMARRLGVQAYLHARSDPFNRQLVTAESVYRPDDGFSFVLINRSGRSVHLLLFALDALNRVHWFYPVLDTDESSPHSVTIPATPQLFPLPDGVTPDEVAEGRLQLIALFTDRPQTVAVVEDRLDRGGVEELRKSFPEAFVQILNLRAQKEATP